MGYRPEPDGSDAKPMMICRCERPHVYYDHEEEVDVCMKCGHVLASVETIDQDTMSREMAF